MVYRVPPIGIIHVKARSAPRLARCAACIRQLYDTLAAWRRDRSGVAAVEFSILMFPFFLLLFAILETSAVFIGETTLNQSVVQASRLVRTGDVAATSMTKSAFKQKICDGITVLLSCSGIVVDLRSYSSFDDIPTQPPIVDGNLDTSSFRFDAVKPSQLMAVRVFYKWPLYTDLFRKFLSNLQDGSHLITAVVVLKTEPFSGG